MVVGPPNRLEHGYNKDLGILADQDTKLRAMPLEQAKAILEDISAEFCFVNDDDGQRRHQPCKPISSRERFKDR
jgi:hypothetical protein